MGPVTRRLVRREAERELRAVGHTGVSIRRMFRRAGDGVFAEAAAAVGATRKLATIEPSAVTAIGDGTIIQRLLDWLTSEQGQAVIAALLKLLLAAL